FFILSQPFSSWRLFSAPSHVERLREIRAALGALPLCVARASEVAIDRESDADCILLDTTGELQRWYGIATIVFIGKSLTAQGGQNPVEPILAGKPVVFGPHMENFAMLAKLLYRKTARSRCATLIRSNERSSSFYSTAMRDSTLSKMRMRFWPRIKAQPRAQQRWFTNSDHCRASVPGARGNVVQQFTLRERMAIPILPV